MPRAKFPVIDIHSHQPTPISAEQLAKVVAGDGPQQPRILVNLSGGWGRSCATAVAAIAGARTRTAWSCSPTSTSAASARPAGRRGRGQLEGDIKAGARGLKIFKDLGLRIRKADGIAPDVDDPELDPIWAACARLGVPVLIHTAEPQEFFETIDFNNERWLELALYKDRRYPAGEFPRFEELLAERDRMFRKHPKTTFIAAHFGYRANDLAKARRCSTRCRTSTPRWRRSSPSSGASRAPRTTSSSSTRTASSSARTATSPTSIPYYWREFETGDEYFDYYRDYHAFWKLYGMGLPDDVLKKLYYKNALKLVPGLYDRFR